MNIHRLYYYNSSWHDQDVTASAKGALAAAGGGLCSFAAPSSDPAQRFAHVCYLAGDQHVHHLYCDKRSWHHQDATASVNGALAAAGSALCTSGSLTKIDHWDGQHVYYVASDQHVHQLGFSTNQQAQDDQDLTASAKGALAAVGSGLSSFPVYEGLHVYYAASDQHVHLLYYDYGVSWQDQDLGKGALVAAGSALSSFPIADGLHVYYVASDQHVHQLYGAKSGWQDQDLTAYTKGALAEAGSGLSSFAIADGQHVYYVANDRYVHQLYYNNSSWHDQRLTGPIVAEAGSALSSFATSEGQHVRYADSDHQVRQLHYDNSNWYNWNLTGNAHGPMAAVGSGLSSLATSDEQPVYFVSW